MKNITTAMSAMGIIRMPAIPVLLLVFPSLPLSPWLLFGSIFLFVSGRGYAINSESGVDGASLGGACNVDVEGCVKYDGASLIDAVERGMEVSPSHEGLFVTAEVGINDGKLVAKNSEPLGLNEGECIVVGEFEGFTAKLSLCTIDDILRLGIPDSMDVG